MKWTLKFDAILRPDVADISFIVILYAKTSVRYVQIICLFLRFANIFLYFFFSKAGFKWSLNTRKPFKINVIKWKAKHLQPPWGRNFSKYFVSYFMDFYFTKILFAVKESCHGNLVIDCWLSNKWNNVRLLLVESSVIVIFTWFF